MLSKQVRARAFALAAVTALLIGALSASAAPIDKPIPPLPTLAPAPAQNATEHARLMGALKPAMRAKVVAAATTALGKISRTSSAVDAARSTLPSVGLVGRTQDDAVEAILFLIMAEAARQTEVDLKTQMEKVREINRKKAAIREVIAKCNRDRACLKGAPPPASISKAEADKLIATELDGPDDDLDQLRLQLFLDRRKALLEVLSTVIAKASATRSSVVSNLDP